MPETHAADAEIKAAVVPPEPERKPDHKDAPAQPQIAMIPPPPPVASSAAAITEAPKPAPKAAMSASQGDMIRYANKIRSRLASHRPTGTGQRGKVVVTFTVGSGGAVEEIDVSQSSGSSRLDRLVISSVRNAAPFPSPPDKANSGQRTFTIPFEFR